MSMLMSRCSLTSKVDVVVFVVLLQQSRRRELRKSCARQSCAQDARQL